VDPDALDQLLRRAKRHDPDALGELAQAFSPRVYGLLYRLTGSRDAAEDYLQETFLRVVRNIATYEHEGRFEAWLFRIAANLARDHARQSRRRGTMRSLDGAEESANPAALSRDAARRPGEALERAEREQRLGASLAALPAADREVLLLRHFSGLSFREVADLLKIPLGTALARAHRALKKLRAELQDNMEP
jgi:RNA polymerase sigma-70 factor (ECF subfamily)